MRPIMIQPASSWALLSRRSALSAPRPQGYQIRRGLTAATEPVDPGLPDGLGYFHGRVLGIYRRGLFEQCKSLEALCGASREDGLESVFEALADVEEERIDLNALLAGIK